jgi:hypothetical protein
MVGTAEVVMTIEKYPDVGEVFFERLLDMTTEAQTAGIFDDATRDMVGARSKLPRTRLFLGAFHAACDDLRVPRDERSELEDNFFEGTEP